jgi:hypothetical protein
MASTLDPVDPGGLRSIHEAEVPIHKPARCTPSIVALPACTPRTMARAIDCVAPAGLRSIHEDGVPLQRLARCTPLIVAHPACRPSSTP